MITEVIPVPVNAVCSVPEAVGIVVEVMETRFA
jgi:hypothetical protein